MRRRRAIFHGCDALDVAALWPSTPQLAGLPLPQVEAETRLETNALPQVGGNGPSSCPSRRDGPSCLRGFG